MHWPHHSPGLCHYGPLSSCESRVKTCFIHTYIYTYTYIHIYIYIYTYMYIYIYVYIYIYGLWLWVMVIHPMPWESLHIYVHIYIYISMDWSCKDSEKGPVVLDHQMAHLPPHGPHGTAADGFSQSQGMVFNKGLGAEVSQGECVVLEPRDF